jgi:betaine-aldehyde dehydrogenase
LSDKLTLRNFVDGAHVESRGGESSDLVDPTTGEVFGTAPVSSAADVDAAYTAADRAFEGWRDSTPSDRQRALLKLADLVEEHADELVQLESRNTGKPLALVASEEIPPAVDHLRFFAGAPGSSRAGPARSTWPGTRPGSGASRSASWAR